MTPTHTNLMATTRTRRTLRRMIELDWLAYRIRHPRRALWIVIGVCGAIGFIGGALLLFVAWPHLVTVLRGQAMLGMIGPVIVGAVVTPAEKMREDAAMVAEHYGSIGAFPAGADIATAIRALPLPEEKPVVGVDEVAIRADLAVAIIDPLAAVETNEHAIHAARRRILEEHVPVLLAALRFKDEKIARAFAEVAAGLERERVQRAKLAVVETATEDVWRWQGDGHDYAESLSCAVVMSADKLRELLAGRFDAGAVRRIRRAVAEIEPAHQDANGRRDEALSMLDVALREHEEACGDVGAWEATQPVSGRARRLSCAAGPDPRPRAAETRAALLAAMARPAAHGLDLEAIERACLAAKEIDTDECHRVADGIEEVADDYPCVADALGLLRFIAENAEAFRVRQFDVPALLAVLRGTPPDVERLTREAGEALKAEGTPVYWCDVATWLDGSVDATERAIYAVLSSPRRGLRHRAALRALERLHLALPEVP